MEHGTETADSLLWTAWPPGSRRLTGGAAHISHCQQPSVKQEQHANKGEEEPKGSEGNANLCREARKGCQAVNFGKHSQLQLKMMLSSLTAPVVQHAA